MDMTGTNGAGRHTNGGRTTQSGETTMNGNETGFEPGATWV